ncbi:MAG TPA: hypothetical protein VK972_04330, partial [Wenzhouxiangella sp.]|nr:hypothetical protein [Wenzhouxiangella sp.]
VRDGAARGLPIAALNRGRTRADELLAFKVDSGSETALAAAVGLQAAVDRPGSMPADSASK